MDGPLKIPLMRMSLMNELLAICYSILKEELHAEQEFIFLFFIFFFSQSFYAFCFLFLLGGNSGGGGEMRGERYVFLNYAVVR